MKKAHFFTAGPLIFLMATACNPGSSPFSPVVRNKLNAAGLRLTVTTASQETGGLSFLIEVKNEGAGTVNLNFSDSQAFDVAVSTSGGNPVWQWSRDKAFSTVLLTQEIKPGDVVSNRAEWSLTASDGSQVRHGLYKATVWITNQPRDPGLSIEFALTI